MRYTYSQVFESSIKYFDGDEFAAKVFVDKYALQDLDGNYMELTPEAMHKRLAKEFARIERKYPNPLSEDLIFSLFDKFKYCVPQGSPMSAIGNPYQIQSLSNCFVVQGVYSDKLDSYGGIMLADQELAQIMKRRGGVGLDISGIRPKGAVTANSAKTTDGIAVFMDRFSNTCREVAQNGRRGAEMQTLSVNHPEIETFINIKRDLKKVTGANISIRLNDEFMNAVKNNEDYVLRWPVECTPDNAKITKKVKAKEIWDQIIDSAWTSAEPGLLFWDTVKKTTPSDIYSKFGHNSISTNPCGEIVLPAYDACRLLVLNLSSYVKNPFTKDAIFDYDLFHDHTIIAQRLMDDIIDLELESIDRIIEKINRDPEPQEAKSVELNLWNKIRKMNESGRRTGLGITALGDCLAMLNVKYGSEESVNITREIYRALAVGSHTSSVIMAEERGAFPIFNYNLEKDHKYLSSIMKDCAIKVNKKWKKFGRRNIANTTTAPTGSVSAMTQTTSGIEPVYLLSYVRRKKHNPSDKNARIDFVDNMGDSWQEFTVYHHGLKRWMDATGETDISKSPYYGATSNEINWLSSVEIQAAAQESIDHSISKTCNLPESATKELVSDVYMKAWELGCKGFTVYRDKCRAGVLINESESKSNKLDGRPGDIQYVMAPKRPIELPCEIKKVKINGEAWTFFIGKLNGQPYEVFGGLSKFVDIPNKHKIGRIVKNGKVDGLTTYNLKIGEGDDEMVIRDIANIFENANFGAFTRTISLALRHGTPVQYVVEQLLKDRYSDITSFSKVAARVLKAYIQDGTKSTVERKCPECGAENSFIYQEKCLRCSKCPYSKC
ncbi:ribonucleotide-diphosphate reductase subunit alpha [uncultured Caudovirales phage]|uniref:ribonucleoside-diphosphate reductase n=1 Tax=uncultured Caudovirales phage TaxID=2100421 RepID=A0A6J5RSJ4_9CAUD|nr:ribonucleotide-diphosphate reductase subunit alpha [uncultured Caudovirales phage]